MFQRFSERARRVVVIAQDEARALEHGYVGSEHLLLGLLGADEELAAGVLGPLHATIEDVRSQVARTEPWQPPGRWPQAGRLPFTPRAKQVLERALHVSMGLRDECIDTEHVLVAVTYEHGVAMGVLESLGAEHERIRRGALDRLSQQRGESSERRH